MSTIKVTVETEEAFVEASYEEVRSTLARAAVGNRSIGTGFDPGDAPVLRTLAGLTLWAEAAQRRHDPEAADYLQANLHRHWSRALAAPMVEAA